jgi:hypothetical protein
MTHPRYDRGALALGIGILGMLAIGIVGMPQGSKAQTPCSVLDDRPCTPYFCGIHSGPGCVPDIFYPLGQDLRLKLDVRGDAPQPPDRDKPLDSLKDIAPTLSKCLQLPPQDMARPGMQVTMRLGFSKSGKVLGTPRFTYITHEAPEGVRTAYRSAATDMLDRCQPLPLSAGLGGAIAGRPFIISIIDDRKDTKESAHEQH